MAVEYILRSQSGKRDVTVCDSEAHARARLAEMSAKGVNLRLFKVSRLEVELVGLPVSIPVSDGGRS